MVFEKGEAIKCLEVNCFIIALIYAGARVRRLTLNVDAWLRSIMQPHCTFSNRRPLARVIDINGSKGIPHGSTTKAAYEHQSGKTLNPKEAPSTGQQPGFALLLPLHHRTRPNPA